MSTPLLYHAYGINGVHYQSTKLASWIICYEGQVPRKGRPMDLEILNILNYGSITYTNPGTHLSDEPYFF